MVDINPTSHLEDDVVGDAVSADESPRTDAEWLALARTAFKSSTSYIDSNLRPQWERSIRLFQNQHPSGSKYQSNAYKRRSRIFRPKTRSSVRRGEAAVAAAFFATQDAVSIRPNDDRDPVEVARGRLWHAALNFRLMRTIPWFRLCVGAYQDAAVNGFCVSKQYWRYETDAFGNPTVDRPVIDLIPPENVRIDPGADWLDPVNSSPYIIGLFPMYVGDVKAKIERGEWLPVETGNLRDSQEQASDSTRDAREGKREDKYDRNTELGDHETCWVHENIFRVDGEDWHFWTAGTQALLSYPVPLSEIYVQGERPYVMGHVVLESHRAYPSSKVELTQDLQTEANDVANLRLDNVKLALMPITKVRQGVGVDIAGLVNRVPGKVLTTPNPESDIVEDRPPDVTGSAFAEQDRINVDYDELAGSFSTSSVASNRKLNETVGGMSLLNSAAGAIMEYDLRVFAETWVEPVLRQILALEQAYETDEVILAIAAKEAEIVGPIPPHVMDGDVHLSVNVGIGATNPNEQLQKFQIGVDLLGKIFGPAAAMRANFGEVVTEIFGKLGYRDGLRFFNAPDDPRVAHLVSTIEQLQQQLEAKQPEIEGRNQVAMIQAQSNIREQEIENDAKILIKQMEIEQERLRQENDMLRQARDFAATRTIELDRAAYTSATAKQQAEESRRTEREKAAVTAAAKPPEPEKPPIDMDKLANAFDGMAKAMNSLSEATTQMAQAANKMSQPKRIVRDENGTPIGVE